LWIPITRSGTNIAKSKRILLITLVNTQNVSVSKIVDSFSIQRAESKYDVKIQFLALVVVMHEVWLNPLNPELNPICYLLALLGAHHFFHVSRIRVKLLTFRRLMSYIYIWSTQS